MKTLEELNMQIIEQVAEKDKIIEKLSKNYIGKYIKLIDETGSFCIMKISKVVTGTEYSNAKAVTNAVSDKIAVFEIDLLNSNDVKVQPNGKVSITTDIPNGFDPSRVVVYRLSADGKSYTKLTSTVSGGKISFETDHFSTYIVAQESVTKVTDNNKYW